MTDDRPGSIIHENSRAYGADGAHDYQANSYHGLRIKQSLRLLDEALQDRSGARKARVLDLGAGSGAVSEHLEQAGHLPYALEIALEAALGILHTAPTVLGDGSSSLPFRNQAFDAIYSGELIEHIFDTRSHLLECNRVLTDGGLLVITTPNLAGLQDRLRLLIGHSPRHIDPLHSYLWLHIRPFTMHKLRQCLSEAGFGVTAVRSNMAVFTLRDKRIHVRWLANLWPTLGGTLIVIARKKHQ